jgi:hypothetical protein
MDGEFGECETVTQKYRNSCHKLFRLSSLFFGEDNTPKVNGLDEKPAAEEDLVCDGELWK